MGISERPIERSRTPGTPRAINNLGYEVDVGFVRIGSPVSFDSIEVMAKVNYAAHRAGHSA